jgi:hypothetical protein
MKYIGFKHQSENKKTVPEGEDNNIYITSLSCDKRKKQLGKSVGVYIAKYRHIDSKR